MPAPTETSATPAALTHDGHEVLFPPLPYHMDERAKSAVDDDYLQASVQKATLLKDIARKAEFASTFGPKHQPLRRLAESIRQHTLENLDYYLDRFIDTATAAGVQIHFAEGPEQANAICLDIARAEGVRTCVKSKSMVTEETQLLRALEGAGIETVETDLGEFILQLDHDAPSHIVTPMIHKDRIAVAKAFERELGAEYTEDPQELTQIARKHIRAKYEQSDLGVSGGNFLVAESGSLIICTNEGNGRFCTTAPRVHVAVVGIEKVVPTHEHAAVLLKLLARSSTAQPLTCYTHIITGPRRAHEHDGPEQVHIILMDNGRTEILADEEFREALRCIRCGACLNACPVYRKVGGHSYGSVYSGPIGAVITPLLRGLGNYKDLPNASSLCGACFEACPVRIDLPKLLIKLRRNQHRHRMTGLGERIAMKLYGTSLRWTWSYRMGLWLQRTLIRPKADADGYVHKVPGPMAGWTAVRDLPAPARQSFRKWWKDRGTNVGKNHE